MGIKNIKLVTFDVTNTLLKFKVPAWRYYAMVAQDHGFNGTEQQVETNFKKSFKYMLKKHPNFGKESIKWEDWWSRVVGMTLKDNLPRNANLDAIARRLIDEFRTDKCWECAQGGDKVISHFRKLGISVGVISNYDPRLNDILQNISLHKYFEFIITSYDVGYSKPDTRIFKSAIEKCTTPVSPSEALHIGDDVVKDYEGARAAGWHAVLINPKLKAETMLPQEHVFKSLEELSLAVEQGELKL